MWLWHSNNVPRIFRKMALRLSKVIWGWIQSHSTIVWATTTTTTTTTKSLQSCLTLRDPIDGSPPGSPSLGFSRQEHWSGLPFPSPEHESEKWKWSHSVMSDSATPRTAAYQAPLSVGFSRQEYWSGSPLPSPSECMDITNKHNLIA